MDAYIIPTREGGVLVDFLLVLVDLVRCRWILVGVGGSCSVFGGSCSVSFGSCKVCSVFLG